MPSPLRQRTRLDRAFERLYRRHVAGVYRYALGVLGDSEDAEAVTQTTFLNAYRAFASVPRRRDPAGWLLGLAHQVCAQRDRQALRRDPGPVLDDDETETPRVPSPADVRRATWHLGFRQRAALALHELEGRSYSEIGEALDISDAAAEALVLRARESLHERLARTLTCDQAELAISKRLDAALALPERRRLRAHLHDCADCRRIEQLQVKQRALWKALAAVPLPASLAEFAGARAGAPARFRLAFPGGFLRATTVGAGALLIAGATYETARQAPWQNRDTAVDSMESSRVAEVHLLGLAAGERRARGESAAGQSVGLARGEERARAAAPGRARRAAPTAAVGLARSERRARNDAKHTELETGTR